MSLLHLGGLAGVRFSWWEDSHLLLGEDWRRRILTELHDCDYGLLLLSPGFFGSRFILEEELPRLLGRGVDKVLPVMLKRVPLDGSRELHGVDTRQIFLGSGGRCFTETRGPRPGALRARARHQDARACVERRLLMRRLPRRAVRRHLDRLVDDLSPRQGPLGHDAGQTADRPPIDRRYTSGIRRVVGQGPRCHCGRCLR